MCRRVECSDCHKPTFAGCGAHIEQVLGDVPKDQRCTCREDKKKGAGASSEPTGGSLRRFFGL
jgi:hypothetical protein